MSDPYIGEIRMFGGNFAPVDWAFCNGQLLTISENPALYNLLGTTYGGDGQTTFGVPNLQGRVPVDQGPGYVVGQSSGAETVTLVGNELPSHTHAFNATTNAANASSPATALPAGGGKSIYFASAPNVTMSAQAVQATGGNQPHDNMMPYLAVSFIISLSGIYPTQT